jgi:hypothetical protein
MRSPFSLQTFYPMKNKLLLLFALCLSTLAFSQTKFGIKVGLSTPSGQFGSLTVNHLDTNFMVSLKDAKYGLQGGLWFRFGNKFFFQPEVYFNSNSSDYELDGNIFQKTLKSEKYQYLDVPFIFGAKIGPLSLQAGPVGHYFVASTSELTDIAGYAQKFDEFTFGYQAGGGLDFGRIGLDVRYQGKFNNKDNHMTFFGQQYQFDNNPARITASLRIKLF